MKSRILVVDEDEIVRVGLVEGLDRKGFEPLQVSSVGEALDFLDREAVDLVLADLVLKEAGGLTFLKQMRERHPDLPVVGITGQGATAVTEALQSGASDCIVKPATSDEISNRIQSVLDAAGLRNRLSSEQNLLREKRRESDQRLVHADRGRALQTLATGLERQLAGPCETLRRSVRLLTEGIASDDPLKRAVQAVDQALGPLETLRTHLRRAARPFAIQLEPMDLQVVLHKLLAADVQTQLRGRHPHVRFTASLSLQPLPILGTTEAMGEVVRSLLATAFNQLPRGGRVWMASSREQDLPESGLYRESRAGLFAHLIIGFSARLSSEQSDRFFEPFGLFPETGGEADDGFVLPESLARVQAMRGFIRLQAAGEDGTEVHVHFPLSNPAVHAAAPTESIRGSEGVLVVDDHTGQRLDTGRLLEGLGYRVHAVATGEEAVQFVRNHLEGRGPGAELILLDLILGEALDGTEVSRLILAMAPESRILLAGGFVETDRVVEARRMGVLDYLRKPLTRESLGNAIRSALRDR
jgi:CheY-like chemotaxis protein